MDVATDSSLPEPVPENTPAPGIDSETLRHAQRALDKAKIQLMTRPDSVFIMTVCFSLRHLFTEDVVTAATDGRTVWYHPAFLMRLNPEQQLGLLLHETWCCRSRNPVNRAA